MTELAYTIEPQAKCANCCSVHITYMSTRGIPCELICLKCGTALRSPAHCTICRKATRCGKFKLNLTDPCKMDVIICHGLNEEICSMCTGRINCLALVEEGT